MTQLTHQSEPGDPEGRPATPNTGNPLASSGAQQLEDGAALENDGSQWGPKRMPRTDAADSSAAEQTGDTTGERAVVASDTADLDPPGETEPYLQDPGREDGAGRGTASPSPGLPNAGTVGTTHGRGDAAR